jgi:hypothetical protein
VQRVYLTPLISLSHLLNSTAACGWALLFTVVAKNVNNAMRKKLVSNDLLFIRLEAQIWHVIICEPIVHLRRKSPNDNNGRGAKINQIFRDMSLI